jgi:hypothetical protein
MADSSTSRPAPVPSRPYAPGYGISTSAEGTLDWGWARTRLEAQRIYWVCTASADGRPHAAPVWGVWHDDVFYFSTGSLTRKYRNLAQNPRCVVGVDIGEESLTVEGVAERVGSTAQAERFPDVLRAYNSKYATDLVGMDEPLFAVTPQLVIAQIDREGLFATTATKWTWPGE